MKETRIFMYDVANNNIVSVDPADPASEGFKKIKNYNRITTNPKKFDFMNSIANKYNEEVAEGKSYILSCKDCGEYIFINEKEAKWYKDHGYDIPKRCKDCRQKRKEQSKAEEEVK